MRSKWRIPTACGTGVQIMNRILLALVAVALTVTAAAAQAPTREALIARAKSFELDTAYAPPPGDPLTHHAAGFAKVICSAVFMTGLAPDFATQNVGLFHGALRGARQARQTGHRSGQ